MLSKAARTDPQIDEPAEYSRLFRKCLLETYFKETDQSYLDSPDGIADVENHIHGRMREMRERLIPWISDVYDLRGKTALEIGTGTGSSATAIAPFVARLATFDIGGPAVAAAKERARLMGNENIVFNLLDPAWAQSSEGIARFSRQVGSEVDVILLVALLEHLTIDERLSTLSGLWSLLKPGGLIVIYETPNRLNWNDWHSFWVPFFHTLPDELAVKYSIKSKRPHFSLENVGADVFENLYRLGRGVSYHEFELAIGLENFEVLNDGRSGRLSQRKSLAHATYDRALDELFETHLPRVDRGFALPSLDLVLRKRGPGEVAHPKKRGVLPQAVGVFLQRQERVTKEFLTASAANFQRVSAKAAAKVRHLTKRLGSRGSSGM